MNTKRQVVVTGIGVISPFGLGLQPYWDALVSGATAIRPIQRFDSSGYRGKTAAEISQSVYEDQALRQSVGFPEEDATYLTAIAIKLALEDANLPAAFGDDDRVGCAMGTLCAAVRNQEQHSRALMMNNGVMQPIAGKPNSALLSYYLEHLTTHFNLNGPSSLVSTACASSTDSIGMGLDMIRQGACEIAIVGGGDILGEVVHAGFNSFFSITNTRMSPFDTSRDGFAIGEGAAILVIESVDSALNRGADIYCELLGYGLSNAAYHLSATTEDGAGETLAVNRAIQDSGLQPNQIDYVNAHGTATKYNDATEIKVIRSVFGDHARHIHASSIKPAIGHCMGAAGAMEAVSTIMTLTSGVVPPTINTRGNEPGMGFNLVIEKAKSIDVRHAISESFGFGGACSCVAFGKFGKEVSTANG